MRFYKKRDAQYKVFVIMLFCLLQVGGAEPFVVVIDPGHGGELVKGYNDGSQKSHGASYNNATAELESGNVLEKDLALEYSKAIAEELNKVKGIQVILTRKDDVSRSAMWRAAVAVEYQADVFLAVHFNGGGGHGSRAYIVAEDHPLWEYMRFGNSYVERDKAFSKILVESLDYAFKPYGGKPSQTAVYHDSKLSAPSDPALGKGKLKDGIRTLGYARMDSHLYNAAVSLLEVEFLDNPEVTQWLLGERKEEVKRVAARSIAQTIVNWREKRKEYLVPAPQKMPK